MSDLAPFNFSICPAPRVGWLWSAMQHDGRVAQGEAPTRAAAAAYVIRVLARSHMEAAMPTAVPGSRCAG